MTADDILKHYPCCRTAVAYCELILDTADPDDPVTSFDVMRSAIPPITLEDAFAVIKEALADETACKAQQALAEMEHPQFLVYLRAKLGMM